MTFYSLAFSIKINPIFCLPGYLFILVCRCGIIKALSLFIYGLTLFLLLSLPFLLTNTAAYINQSFPINRRINPTDSPIWLMFP